MAHKRLSAAIFFILLIILTAMVFTGCATIDKPLDPKIYYMNDMDLTVNGKKCFGVCLPDEAQKYDIEIVSRQDMDQLVVSTCMRTWPVPTNDAGWKKKKRNFIWSYVPQEMEKAQGCSMSIWGADQDRGKHSFARIFFHNKKNTMKAGVSCNGDSDYTAVGSAACQAMQGQKMKIWFWQKVEMEASKVAKPGEPVMGCQVKPTVDGYSWIINLPVRECVFKFYGASEQFLLYTIGAEDAPIRRE